MEKVDILVPPMFNKSGVVKTQQQAWKDEDWIGVFNLWVIQNNPVPSIVYQQRSSNSSWAPNKLDVTAGGYYRTGETMKDGLREVKEELGKNYARDTLTYLGQKIYIGVDTKGREKKNLVDIFMVFDNSGLDSYVLDSMEVHSIYFCSIKDLLKVRQQPDYTFFVEGIDSKGEKKKIKVSKQSFPYNWDNYHLKIALLAERFVKGEKNLTY